MDPSSTIKPKFLANATDLGVVAVGFSGGQVRWTGGQQMQAEADPDSANPVSMPLPLPSLPRGC